MEAPQKVNHLGLRERHRVRVIHALATGLLVAVVHNRFVERVPVEILLELSHKLQDRLPHIIKHEGSTFLFLHIMKTEA